MPPLLQEFDRMMLERTRKQQAAQGRGQQQQQQLPQRRGQQGQQRWEDRVQQTEEQEGEEVSEGGPGDRRDGG